MIAGSLEIQMAMNLARLTDDMAKSKNIVGGAMQDMNNAIGTVKTALGALGITLSVGYFVSFLKGTNDAIAHMKELGQEAGTSAEAISRFEAPARSAGLGLDIVAAAMFKMNKAALEGRDPTTKAGQALAAIGISTAQLKGLKPDEMFELIARSIDKYSDGLSKNNVMQELFGKSGREMNRVVAAIAEQGKLTATVTVEQVAAAKKLNDQILELQMNSEKLWRGIVAEGVPALSALISEFTKGKEIAGGFWAALKLFGTINPFREVTGNLTVLREDLEAAERRLAGGISGEFLGVDVGRTESEIAAIKKKIEFLKLLQLETVAQANYSNEQRRAGVSEGAKPSIAFDPAASEAALKRELHNMKQVDEAHEVSAKEQEAIDALTIKHIEDKMKAEEAYQRFLGGLGIEQIAAGQKVAESFRTQTEIENDEYAKRLSDLNAYLAASSNDEMNADKLRERLSREHQDRLNVGTNLALLQRTQMWRGALEGNLNDMSGVFGEMSGLMMSSSKKMFEIGKIAARAKVLTDAAAMIQSAFATQPFFPLGLAMGAGAIALAAVNWQRINSVQFNGGGITGGGSPSLGGVSGAAATPGGSGSTLAAPPPAQSTVTITVNIITNVGNVIGDDGIQKLVDDNVIPALQDAIDNRDVVIIGQNSRQAANLLPA